MVASKDYWQRRSLYRLTMAEKKSEPYLKQIYGLYTDAQRQTVRDIQKLYNAYYRENKWNTTALNEIAPSGDLNRFYADLRTNGLDTRLPDRFRGRLSRLEMLNAQLWGEAKKVALRQSGIQRTAHTETIKDSYYRTIFDTAKGNGAIPAFSTLDQRTIDQVLNAKFVGSSFSERVWKNTDKLADSLQQVLGKAIATGQAPEVTARELRNRFNVSKSDAMRLVRTETAYFENASEIEAYKEMNIKRFQFLATLDSRTSEICREHDHKVYWVSQAVIGENVPPLHPYCRSKVTPYIGKEYQAVERIARDPANNQNYYVAGDMNYGMWEQTLVKRFADRLSQTVNITGIAQGSLISTDFGAVFDANSLMKMDNKLLTDVVDRAETLLNSYPDVQEWVTRQGGLRIMGTDGLRSGTIAATNRLRPIMRFSNRYYSSYQKMVKTMFNDIKKGHSMPATKYKSYTFNHEFGHLVENYILRKKNTDYMADKVRNDIIKIAMKQSKLTRQQVISQISGYGTKNSREFFAESFANMQSGRPNVLGKAMKTYLKREFRK